jgi:UDP-glucose-4-epimerase GalE
MTVLVTGGAGYIGAHTVRELIRRGREVVVLDTLELGHRAAVGEVPLVVGSSGDAELVRRVCADHRVDSVIHFAAYKNVGESMANPLKYWENNVAGTVELFRALRDAGVGRLVFSSSCSVYGTPANLPVDEDAPIAPESVYAQTKATIEQLLDWNDQTIGFRSASLRYFNAAGASADGSLGEDWTQSLNLIPLVMKATLGRRPPVHVFGDDYPTPDGTCVRDYVHVDDLADAHVRALDHLEQHDRSLAVNLGTGRGSSVMEVIETTARISGLEVPYDVVPRRIGDPVSVYADPSRARELLDWTPQHGLEDIISSAWRWHSTHLDGYDAAA